jgi:hypothetical protein
MTSLTPVRPQTLASGATPHPAPTAPIPGGGVSPAASRAAPVAPPQHRDAPRLIEGKFAPDAHLTQGPPDPTHATAEAARRAYIRASIAAGVNPLPLPGR